MNTTFVKRKMYFPQKHLSTPTCHTWNWQKNRYKGVSFSKSSATYSAIAGDADNPGDSIPATLINPGFGAFMIKSPVLPVARSPQKDVIVFPNGTSFKFNFFSIKYDSAVNCKKIDSIRLELGNSICQISRDIAFK